jgi:hypothetical protein
MNRLDFTRRVAGITVVIGIALSSGGCADTLGPVPRPVARVRGVVREGDRPVAGGWIEFVPVDGTVGNLRSARIGADGSFDAVGVPVGENAIRLVNERVAKTPYLWLFGEYRSPIRRVIPANPTDGLIRIDLVEEAIRFQELRRRGAVGAPAETGEAP